MAPGVGRRARRLRPEYDERMNRRTFLTSLAAPAALASLARLGASGSSWQAGAASVDITPGQSLWMAGFALRKQPSQGTALPLRAKALALRAGQGRVAVLVTVDLLGLTARITDRVAAEVGRRHGVARADLLFNASHTHCGPIVDDQLAVAYDLSAQQWEALHSYTAELETHLVAVIGRAIEALRPARLSYGRGEAAFAANRRVTFSPDGPVDRAVPVLKVEGADGGLLAIAFGYACHNTTLQDGFVQYHGDYAGVAQAALERRHPGATALFVMGCGADANPKPRGTLELVEAHGAALADAVDAVLGQTSPIAPGLRTAYGAVDLPFVGEAERARWHQQLDIDPVYLRRHAALMESIVRRDGRLPPSQRDPVQVWRFGSRDLTLVALGGEVVVDYDLRLQREHPADHVWAAGYSNDVFGYVPSQRVRREGGYEGADAMIYYGRPGPFTDDVEARIIGEVDRLLRRTR